MRLALPYFCLLLGATRDRLLTEDIFLFSRELISLCSDDKRLRAIVTENSNGSNPAHALIQDTHMNAHTLKLHILSAKCIHVLVVAEMLT